MGEVRVSAKPSVDAPLLGDVTLVSGTDVETIVPLVLQRQ
jgi:hypothetical protein